MSPWINLVGLGALWAGLTYAAEALRPVWRSGFRSNTRTILGDARGRKNQPFGYVGIPQESGYAPAHAPDDLGECMQNTT